MAAAVRADRTVTFGYLKPGLLCHPGASLAGNLTLVDIGLPNLNGGQPFINLSTSHHVRALLPARPSDSNKGTFGTVLAIAGSLGMSGAPLLATSSSLKTGAGLVLLATPKSLVANLPPGEVIYIPIDETKNLSIGLAALPAISAKMEKCSAVILGPGMSTNEETVQFVHKFLQETIEDADKPCIIDADALNAIAKKPDVFPKAYGHKIVLTPHPKELSRLMDMSVQEIQADRINSAVKAAQQFNCTIVLKGSRTVVAAPDAQVFINPTGNPGMATAGAGDVLSGIIGALLAQGLAPIDAATVGTYIHGLAGDLAAAQLGESGVIAGDIKDAIPYAIQAVEKGEMSEIERQIFGLDSDTEN
jgi:NAD(P)H-hydrate epimerase